MKSAISTVLLKLQSYGRTAAPAPSLPTNPILFFWQVLSIFTHSLQMFTKQGFLWSGARLSRQCDYEPLGCCQCASWISNSISFFIKGIPLLCDVEHNFDVTRRDWNSREGEWILIFSLYYVTHSQMPIQRVYIYAYNCPYFIWYRIK